MTKRDLSYTQREALRHFAGEVITYPMTGDRWHPPRSTVATLENLGLIKTTRTPVDGGTKTETKLTEAGQAAHAALPRPAGSKT